jgi:hypothetical protein
MKRAIPGTNRMVATAVLIELEALGKVFQTEEVETHALATST